MREWITGPRNHLFTNSYTTSELGDYIRVHYPEMPKYIGRGIFSRLIRAINTKIAEKTLEGHCVTLPMRMGYIEIRKRKLPDPKIRDGKLILARPVDWEETMKLWESDKTARERKIIVKKDIQEKFFIYYNKYKCNFTNKNYTILRPCREFYQALYRKVHSGEIEAPEFIKIHKNKKRK